MMCAGLVLRRLIDFQRYVNVQKLGACIFCERCGEIRQLYMETVHVDTKSDKTKTVRVPVWRKFRQSTHDEL
jgi:hypothetical protein